MLDTTEHCNSCSVNTDRTYPCDPAGHWLILWVQGEGMMTIFTAFTVSELVMGSS